MEEITFGGNRDSEKEDKEIQGPSICKRGYWKNLLPAQLLEQNALSNINRQSFSILSGLWLTLTPKILTCLHIHQTCCSENKASCQVRKIIRDVTASVHMN